MQGEGPMCGLHLLAPHFEEPQGAAHAPHVVPELLEAHLPVLRPAGGGGGREGGGERGTLGELGNGLNVGISTELVTRPVPWDWGWRRILETGVFRQPRCRFLRE